MVLEGWIWKFLGGTVLSIRNERMDFVGGIVEGNCDGTRPIFLAIGSI